MTPPFVRCLSSVRQSMSVSRVGVSKRARGGDDALTKFVGGEGTVEQGTLIFGTGQETDNICNESIDKGLDCVQHALARRYLLQATMFLVVGHMLRWPLFRRPRVRWRCQFTVPRQPCPVLSLLTLGLTMQHFNRGVLAVSRHSDASTPRPLKR